MKCACASRKPRAALCIPALSPRNGGSPEHTREHFMMYMYCETVIQPPSMHACNCYAVQVSVRSAHPDVVVSAELQPPKRRKRSEGGGRRSDSCSASVEKGGRSKFLVERRKFQLSNKVLTQPRRCHKARPPTPRPAFRRIHHAFSQTLDVLSTKHLTVFEGFGLHPLYPADPRFSSTPCQSHGFSEVGSRPISQTVLLGCKVPHCPLPPSSSPPFPSPLPLPLSSPT